MIGRLGADGGVQHTKTKTDTESLVMKHRFLGFLIWQSLQSTLVFFLSITLLSPFLSSSSSSITSLFLSFIFFHLSLILFSSSLFLVSSPQPLPGVSLSELFFGLLKLIFVFYGGGQPFPPDFRRRLRVTSGFLVFVASSSVSAFLSLLSLSGLELGLGLRGFALGLVYASHYLFTNRWVLDFPILQRPLFFSYKMGIRKAVVKAVSLSSAGYLVSLVLPIFVSDRKMAMRALVVEQIVFYFASCVVFLCWELNRHLLQVCAWSARIASSLTIRSHKEDRLGVAQLSGCNAATITTLLACLLAVETLMGKKTHLQPSNTQYPANIKWAALSPTTATLGITSNKKDGPHYLKAYSMADILRTSIYQIVSNFHHEMDTSSKSGLLEKDWISNGKPLYGSRELIVHKLKMFLEYQAN
ncbi:hypothetical protein M8C21_008789 [Ambrosia artemisiifolia]|uniref:Transmembrane protein n=1 Tax=Ambrosia artemisiifolia TaxID=4212 RepID=A0AAD5GA12_AMBAR|nr:hypothetical protein M8C21_008789 [Ambrosia artemisiifolia]